MNHEELYSKAFAGEKDAINQLIVLLQPSVRIVASSVLKIKDFSILQPEQDDMVQEGLIALTHAIRSYQPDKGILFWTYAETVIRNAITDYIRKIYAESSKLGITISLDSATSNDPEDRTFEEIIFNEHAKSPEQIFIEKESLEEMHTALNRISAREREYLCYRFGFDDDEYHDLNETAYHFYLSRSRARQLEDIALDNFSLELPWWY